MNKKSKGFRLVALLLAMLTVLALCLTGCNKNEQSEENPSSSSPSIEIKPADENGDEKEVALEVPVRSDKAKTAHESNKDVVGWLYIPGLTDVDAGVTHRSDSYYYDKRDINGKKLGGIGSGKEYWVYGAYYTHLRNTFGDTSATLSTNTVIFGHSDLGLTNKAYADDDATGPLFSQLFSFKDPNFAEKTPYIYFSTTENDYVWEVFAVFYNDSAIDGGKALWYIEPEPTSYYQDLIDIARGRSLYNYDVDVTTEDKILTLSTCTVGFGIGKRANYRFVIMAKLVENTENLVVKNAKIEINPEAVVPSTFEEEFCGYLDNWKPSTASESSNG